MKRVGIILLAVQLLCLSSSAGWAAETNPEQEKAVALLTKYGGKVTINGTRPEKPVIGVDLSGTEATDAALE